MPIDRDAVTLALGVLQPAWDSAAVQDIEFQPGGYSHHNFRFSYADERYVLRIPQTAQPGTSFIREQTCLAELRGSLYPEVVAYDTDRGYMLTRWIDGELLVDVYGAASDKQPILEQALPYLTQLHAGMPRVSTVYDLHGLCTRYMGGARHLQDENAFASLSRNDLVTPLRACHNDLNPWNIIVTQAGWVTLDWEFAARNDPLFDAVTLFAGLGLEDAQVVARSADFADAAGFAAHARAGRCLRQFWWRELCWAYYQIERGNKGEPIYAQWACATDKLMGLDEHVPRQWRYRRP